MEFTRRNLVGATLQGWGLFIESGLSFSPPQLLPPLHPPHIPGAPFAPSQQPGDRWAGVAGRTRIKASGLKDFQPRNPPLGCPTPSLQEVHSQRVLRQAGGVPEPHNPPDHTINRVTHPIPSPGTHPGYRQPCRCHRKSDARSQRRVGTTGDTQNCKCSDPADR